MSSYYYCYLALQAANDPAARPALQNAHAVVQAQAASITDPDWRAQLLNNIAINRDILHAWQQSSTP